VGEVTATVSAKIIGTGEGLVHKKKTAEAFLGQKWEKQLSLIAGAKRRENVGWEKNWTKLKILGGPEGYPSGWCVL